MDLIEIFEANFDCYTKVENDNNVIEMAMTKTKFLEVVTHILQQANGVDKSNNCCNLAGVRLSLPKLEIGDKIKLYGKETTVKGFTVCWNEAFKSYEIIILTNGRGDPFYRSLDKIELIGNEA